MTKAAEQINLLNCSQMLFDNEITKSTKHLNGASSTANQVSLV